MSQDKLAEKAQSSLQVDPSGKAGKVITSSTIAMAESGRRLPSFETIGAIAVALGLDRFQKRQLEILVEYPHRASKPGDEWFLPDDVLTGIPMFLRTLNKEAAFQREVDMSEMWIVTDRPLALAGEMRDVLKKRLLVDKITFVYFLDVAVGEAPFQSLWSGLAAECPECGEAITERLQCVLTPSSLCLNHFGICNPGAKDGDMFGRSIFYSGGSAIGYAAMEFQHVIRAFRLLDAPYQRCRVSPGKDISDTAGVFRLVRPKIET
jgi:hypothetical protein